MSAAAGLWVASTAGLSLSGCREDRRGDETLTPKYGGIAPEYGGQEGDAAVAVKYGGLEQDAGGNIPPDGGARGDSGQYECDAGPEGGCPDANTDERDAGPAVKYGGPTPYDAGGNVPKYGGARGF